MPAAAHAFYTIDAATAEPATPAQMLLMLQRLLAERFHLQVETSGKQEPVWDLEAASGGPKLKPRGDDMKAAGAPPQAMSGFNGCTLSDLVKAFNRPGNAMQLGRPVVDKTGITGRYHMLVWQAYEVDSSYSGPGRRFSYRGTFRDAVEKELGLKLVSGTATMPSVQVVQVSRPGPN